MHAVGLAWGGWSNAAAQPGQAGAPLRIGVSLGLSGSLEQLGRMQSLGYRLWQRDVNARGGVLGRRVELEIVDDRSDPQTALAAYQRFVDKDRLDFVFAPYSSMLTLAVAPTVDRAGYPTLVAGAAADALWSRGWRNLFGMFQPAGRYAIGMLAVLDETDLRRIAIVSSGDEFSVDASAGMKRWATQYDMEVTHFEVLPRRPASAQDMEQAARAARAAGANALLVAGHFEESVGMRRALRAIGWTPAVFYATVGPALDKYTVLLGSDADGTFSTSIWEACEDLKIPGSARFLQDFVRAHGERPSYQATVAYAAGQVLEQAITKAGTIDRAAVRQALYQLDTDCVIGRYLVDSTGRQVRRFPLIVQWQGGKREVVWPPELRTAPARIAK